MFRAGVVAAALVCAACPERRYPERGTELVFKRQDGGREVFERRLAQLQVKARIVEDRERLSVRLAEGADVAQAKALLLKPGRLELCEERLDDARAWCEAKGSPTVSVDHEPNPAFGCFFSGTSAEAVRQAAAAATSSGRVFLQEADRRFRTFAGPKEPCFSPRLIDGRSARSEELAQQSIRLTLDAQAAHDFEVLTGRLVKQRLLIVLDGEVSAAPVVLEAIPGGKIQLVVPKLSEEDARLLTAALVGGPLEGPELLEERAYGPPRL